MNRDEIAEKIFLVKIAAAPFRVNLADANEAFQAADALLRARERRVSINRHNEDSIIRKQIIQEVADKRDFMNNEDNKDEPAM